MSVNASISSSRSLVALCWLQGGYYLITGVWPLVHVKSFQWVTGPKTDHLVTGREADHWMLNTISALIIAIALVLLAAAARRRVSVDVALLAVFSALALAMIDSVYVARSTISPIYLADGAVELVLAAVWTVCGVRWRRAERDR
jgi:hypothetical protein